MGIMSEVLNQWLAQIRVFSRFRSNDSRMVNKTAPWRSWIAQMFRPNVCLMGKLCYNPRMIKISVIWLGSAGVYLVSAFFQASELDFSVLSQFFSELPILIATVWLFLRLANLHLATMEKLTYAFVEHEQRQREHHAKIVERFLGVIAEIHPNKKQG